MPWSLHFMQNWFIVLWSNFKSWLRLPCVNIDYTLWIQLDTQIYNAKINDFTCWRYILGYVLWGGELLIFIDSQLFETLQTFQFYISFDDQLSRENFFLDDCFHKVQLSNAYHSRKRTLDIKTFTEKCKDRPKELKMCKKMHQRTLINLYLIM